MKKGINLIFIFVITALVGTLGFFTYKLFSNEEKILIPDFSQSTIANVNAWCESLDNSPCTITYEYSDTIEKDYVIYQSMNANEELDDSISFVISLGKKSIVKLPEIDKNTTKEIIEKWAKENELTNVNFLEEANEEVDKGGIIKIEPNEIVSKDTVINVYISLGKSKSNDNAIEIESGKYINLTVEEFEIKIKNLGLKPVHADEKDDISSSVKKGNIVWHGSGAYEKNENVRYGICKGESIINVIKGIYVGNTVDEFKTNVSKLGNSGLSAKHNEDYDSYSSTIEKGLIVKHGSGEYEEKDEINYGISLGEDKDKIIVSYGSYLNLTVKDFEEKISKLGTKGLEANHKKDKDEYSDTITKGNIVWHGSGEYENDEDINYGLSLGSNKKTNNGEIVIKQGEYIGKSLTDFKKEVEELGLIPFHREEWDVKDDKKTTNTIARNGYGTYVDGEKISYGLYIGKSDGDIVVTKGQYVGKTLEEFKKICSELGIVPERSEVYTDDFSDTIPKGSLDYHGSGTYTKGEVIHYTLSLGKKEEAKKVSVTSYSGKTETEFKNYLNSINLKLGSRTTEYSNTYESGKIISNDTGSMYEGSSVNYKVSLGKDNRINVGNYSGKSESELTTFLSNNGLIGSKNELNSSSIAEGLIISNNSGLYEKGSVINYTVSLGRATLQLENAYTYNNLNSSAKTYEEMKTYMQSKLSGFEHVTFEAVTSRDLDPGKIERITYDGSDTYEHGYKDASKSIVVYIVNELEPY